ncbi:MAG: acyl-CoA/acyl-ACP dehydrogenase [Armatimonadetes bacterium]|nr:acyl-CoA/acyl-ACP dehydrogenase [Armatimonadota bacterium]
MEPKVLDAETCIEAAVRFFREEVRPNAQKLDNDPEALRQAIKRLGELNALSIKRPLKYGGPAANPNQVRRFQIEAARASGTFAFLATQHQSATSMISDGSNETLKQEYLPKMANGEKLLGIAFSQLRRAGPPVLTATPVDGGYELNGLAPWVTGQGIYRECVIGATLPDGRALLAILPFPTVEQSGLKPSPPMRLAAMEAAQTISLQIEKFFIPNERVVDVKPMGWISRSDEINVALQGYFAIGCAWAGLDVLKDAADKKNLEFLYEAHAKLSAEVEECTETLRVTQEKFAATQEDPPERLNARAWAIQLAAKCAHAAVVASSGAANSLSHPAQRIYREALVFTVSAQTTAIMDATLQRLTGVK